jgi:hypothetical protein
MDHHDLRDLEQNIYAVGKNISEQEGFYRDVNRFLRQVYPSPTPSRQKRHQRSALSRNPTRQRSLLPNKRTVPAP